MFLKALGIAVLAVVILFPVQVLYELGYFQNYFKHHPGTCRRVAGLNFGSEDFQILSNGQAFVTSGFMYAPFGQPYRAFIKNNNIKGGIYFVDMKKPQTEAIELKFKPSKNFNPSTFRPHGISILERPSTSQHLLYVVNHCEDEEDRVEKFKYLPGSGELEHVKSFFSELFHLTNDLALTKEDVFYISDYLHYKTHFMHVVEQIIGFKLGSVIYYNGSDFTTVASGLFGPNGLILSKDKRYLYVAMPHIQGIHVYEIKSDSSLQLVQDLNVHTSVDNFHLSQDGESLYGGCSPIGLEIAQHLLDPVHKSPSQVVNLPLKDGRIEKDEISQVFYDHGNLISGGSIGSIFDKKLLVGSIINKLVVCDL